MKANRIKPELRARITFYPTGAGGRKSPLRGDLWEWAGFPCRLEDDPEGSYRDCRIRLEGRVIRPGETHDFDMIFLSPDTADRIGELGRFKIWELGIIGEGVPLGS